MVYKISPRGEVKSLVAHRLYTYTTACPALSNPASGAVIVAGYAVGDTATYMCSTGYLLSGDATRTCQADNTWSGSEPTCMTRGRV